MLAGVLGGECLRSFDGAFSECKDAFIFAKPLRFALALHHNMGYGVTKVSREKMIEAVGIAPLVCLD